MFRSLIACYNRSQNWFQTFAMPESWRMFILVRRPEPRKKRRFMVLRSDNFGACPKFLEWPAIRAGTALTQPSSSAADAKQQTDVRKLERADQIILARRHRAGDLFDDF